MEIQTSKWASVLLQCPIVKLTIGDSSLEWSKGSNKPLTISYSHIRDIKRNSGIIWSDIEIVIYIKNSLHTYKIDGLSKGDALKAEKIIKDKFKKHINSFIASQENQIKNASDSFNQLLTLDRYIRNSDYLNWKQNNCPLLNLQITKVKEMWLSKTNNLALHSLSKITNNPQKIIDKRNTDFTTSEISKYEKKLFDVIEKYPLTGEQKEAIIRDEDSNLVIAGAGTGKTSTIVGKVAYIIEKKLCKPDEILLLAFNRKVREELKDRIKSIINCDLNIHTFHSLGMEIIAQVEQRQPSVSMFAFNSFKLEKFIEECVYHLWNDASSSELLNKYFTQYLIPYKSQHQFDSEGKYLEYLKSHDVVTLKDKLKKQKINGQIRTIKYDNVRSFEEYFIANFLYLNQVKYEYEANYKYDLADKKHRQYQPDFYLPDYDIYIEHFGVDKKGRTASYVDTEKYNEEMEWKRNKHEEMGTKLIETFSWERQEGILESSLADKLRKMGVKLEPFSEDEFIEIMKKTRMTNRFTNTTCSFLNLFKSNSVEFSELRAKAKKMVESNRNSAYLEIFELIYNGYEKKLASEREIDFHDMIHKAEKYVRENKHPVEYKYILVDEFQDISMARHSLVNAIREKSLNAISFCVGDDWQSIYRFTGSDLSIMTNFERFFGVYNKSVLSKTFRFNDHILRFSSEFIKRNPKQIKKELTTDSTSDNKSVNLALYEEANGFDGLLDAIDKVCELLNKNSDLEKSVFILGRYNIDNNIRQIDIESLNAKYNKLDIEFLTVHKAKGLEADFVIVIDFVVGNRGFPSLIEDDPLLGLVLVENDDFEFAEERRLFYVALTRAKEKVYLLSPCNISSSFIKEIVKDDEDEYCLEDTNYDLEITTLFEEDKKFIFNESCPECQNGLMVNKEGRYGSFQGCSNFPHCKFTRNIPQTN